MNSARKSVTLAVALMLAGLVSLGYPKATSLYENERLDGCFANGKINLRFDRQESTLTISDGVSQRVVSTNFDRSKFWFGISLKPDLAIVPATDRAILGRGKDFGRRRFIYGGVEADEIEYVGDNGEKLSFLRTKC